MNAALPLVDALSVPDAKSVRDAYTQFLFRPGRFSATVLRRALLLLVCCTSSSHWPEQRKKTQDVAHDEDLNELSADDLQQAVSKAIERKVWPLTAC